MSFLDSGVRYFGNFFDTDTTDAGGEDGLVYAGLGLWRSSDSEDSRYVGLMLLASTLSRLASPVVTSAAGSPKSRIYRLLLCDRDRMFIERVALAPHAIGRPS